MRKTHTSHRIRTYVCEPFLLIIFMVAVTEKSFFQASRRRYRTIPFNVNLVGYRYTNGLKSLAFRYIVWISRAQ